jgi:ribosome-associated translation inhibitor RaiA
VKLERKYKRLKGSKVLFNDIEDIEGKRKSCEIKLNVSGREIFASSRNTNFESAAKETLKVLYKHLHNHYETLTD